MKPLFCVFGLIFGFESAQAIIQQKISVDTKEIVQKSMRAGNQDFIRLDISGESMDRNLGAPELPVRSWLVVGTPDSVRVQYRVFETAQFKGQVYPVQEQECRCPSDKKRTFQFRSEFYPRNERTQVEFLGSYRGQPISRVDLFLGRADGLNRSFELVTRAELSINADPFVFGNENLNDYLIVVPSALADGVTKFVDEKRMQGYNVHVEVVGTPSLTTASLQSLIHASYKQKGIDFVILVGDETSLPMFKVSTSGSSQTPSDLKYFTMDGTDDYIPDVLGSRISAASADQVAIQLQKSIDYEKTFKKSSSGMKKFIGIASNEGSNPSDDQYVRSIADKFKEVIQAEPIHLFQDDSAQSNPAFLNSQINEGSFWLTYLGHGSGTSWPSMNQWYTTQNIKQLSNQSSVKPIIIDVACQNGKLRAGQLGTTFMEAQGFAFGATAYYGGSVDISWHPPAVMARGIAFEQLEKRFKHLGEALLAGQFYLAANWNNTSQVIDNFEWYHLQGDPGMKLDY